MSSRAEDVSLPVLVGELEALEKAIAARDAEPGIAAASRPAIEDFLRRWENVTVVDNGAVLPLASVATLLDRGAVIGTDGASALLLWAATTCRAADIVSAVEPALGRLGHDPVAMVDQAIAVAWSLGSDDLPALVMPALRTYVRCTRFDKALGLRAVTPRDIVRCLVTVHPATVHPVALDLLAVALNLSGAAPGALFLALAASLDDPLQREPRSAEEVEIRLSVAELLRARGWSAEGAVYCSEHLGILGGIAEPARRRLAERVIAIHRQAVLLLARDRRIDDVTRQRALAYRGAELVATQFYAELPDLEAAASVAVTNAREAWSAGASEAVPATGALLCHAAEAVPHLPTDRRAAEGRWVEQCIDDVLRRWPTWAGDEGLAALQQARSVVSLAGDRAPLRAEFEALRAELDRASTFDEARSVLERADVRSIVGLIADKHESSRGALAWQYAACYQADNLFLQASDVHGGYMRGAIERLVRIVDREDGDPQVRSNAATTGSGLAILLAEREGAIQMADLAIDLADRGLRLREAVDRGGLLCNAAIGRIWRFWLSSTPDPDDLRRAARLTAAAVEVTRRYLDRPPATVLNSSLLSRSGISPDLARRGLEEFVCRQLAVCLAALWRVTAVAHLCLQGNVRWLGALMERTARRSGELLSELPLLARVRNVWPLIAGVAAASHDECLTMLGEIPDRLRDESWSWSILLVARDACADPTADGARANAVSVCGRATSLLREFADRHGPRGRRTSAAAIVAGLVLNLATGVQPTAGEKRGVARTALELLQPRSPWRVHVPRSLLALADLAIAHLARLGLDDDDGPALLDLTAYLRRRADEPGIEPHLRACLAHEAGVLFHETPGRMPLPAAARMELAAEAFIASLACLQDPGCDPPPRVHADLEVLKVRARVGLLCTLGERPTPNRLTALIQRQLAASGLDALLRSEPEMPAACRHMASRVFATTLGSLALQLRGRERRRLLQQAIALLCDEVDASASVEEATVSLSNVVSLARAHGGYASILPVWQEMLAQRRAGLPAAAQLPRPGRPGEVRASQSQKPAEAEPLAGALAAAEAATTELPEDERDAAYLAQDRATEAHAAWYRVALLAAHDDSSSILERALATMAMRPHRSMLARRSRGEVGDLERVLRARARYLDALATQYDPVARVKLQSALHANTRDLKAASLPAAVNRLPDDPCIAFLPGRDGAGLAVLRPEAGAPLRRAPLPGLTLQHLRRWTTGTRRGPLERWMRALDVLVTVRESSLLVPRSAAEVRDVEKNARQAWRAVASSVIWNQGTTSTLRLVHLLDRVKAAGYGDRSAGARVDLLDAAIDSAWRSMEACLRRCTSELARDIWDPLVRALPELMRVGTLDLVPSFHFESLPLMPALELSSLAACPVAPRWRIPGGPGPAPSDGARRWLCVAPGGSGATAPLLHLDEERRQVSAMPSAGFTELTGPACTVEQVSREMLNLEHDALLYAGHAQFEPLDPLFSGLVLAGEQQLRCRRIACMDLKHLRLAYLSACETALVDSGDPTQRLDSICNAFLAAGVGEVVATGWLLSDEGAVPATGAFVRRLSDGASPAEALRLARVALMKDQPATVWAAHAVWTM